MMKDLVNYVCLGDYKGYMIRRTNNIIKNAVSFCNTFND